VIIENTIAPGGTFGWHSHPGPSLVIVKSGTAAFYMADDPSCTPRVVPAGSGFVDSGADVHVVRNEGTVDLVTVVASLIPAGAQHDEGSARKRRPPSATAGDDGPLPRSGTRADEVSERKTGVKDAEVITARLVQDERGWLWLAGWVNGSGSQQRNGRPAGSAFKVRGPDGSTSRVTASNPATLKRFEASPR